MKKVPSFTFARAAAQAADEKQGEDIVALDVRALTSVSECFMFIGGSSHVHVKTLEDVIRDRLRDAGADLKRTDGQRGHSWRVLDYGDLMVHIMVQSTREFYSIERLWDQGKKISLIKPKAAPKKKTSPPRKPKAKPKPKAKKSKKK